MKATGSRPSAGRLLAVVIGAALAAPAGALAAGPDLLNNTWSIGLGLFDPDTGTKVQLNGDTSVGDKVDLENTFDASDSTQFRLDGFWRFAERHKLRFMWFNSDVDRTRMIDEEIRWGDEVFPVDADVSFERKFDVYQASYQYAFMRRDSFELAASAGLHYTEMSATLAADVPVAGEPDLTRKASETARLNAPLPVLGLYGTWRIGGDFWLDAGAQWFALSFDEYDGSILDLRAVALWQPRNWLGLGLGYNSFNVDIDVDRSGFDGSLDWEYEGLQLFLNLAF